MKILRNGITGSWLSEIAVFLLFIVQVSAQVPSAGQSGTKALLPVKPVHLTVIGRLTLQSFPSAFLLPRSSSNAFFVESPPSSTAGRKVVRHSLDTIKQLDFDLGQIPAPEIDSMRRLTPYIKDWSPLPDGGLITLIDWSFAEGEGSNDALFSETVIFDRNATLQQRINLKNLGFTAYHVGGFSLGKFFVEGGVSSSDGLHDLKGAILDSSGAKFAVVDFSHINSVPSSQDNSQVTRKLQMTDGEKGDSVPDALRELKSEVQTSPEWKNLEAANKANIFSADDNFLYIRWSNLDNFVDRVSSSGSVDRIYLTTQITLPKAKILSMLQKNGTLATLYGVIDPNLSNQYSTRYSSFMLCTYSTENGQLLHDYEIDETIAPVLLGFNDSEFFFLQRRKENSELKFIVTEMAP